MQSNFLISSFCTSVVARVLRNVYIKLTIHQLIIDTRAYYLFKQRVDFGSKCEFDAQLLFSEVVLVESYMRKMQRFAGTCTDSENLCCDLGMSVEIEESSSEEQLESETIRTTTDILKDLRFTYTKAFTLSLSNLHICEDLLEDLDLSALRDSRLTRTKEYMLSLSNLQICIDLPKDFDPSVLRDSGLKYTKEFMLSLSNLQICKDLPDDFDGSALRDLRLTYTKEFMLSLSNLQICKDLPDDFDGSALRDLRLTYTKEFMLSLSNLQICKDLPKDFDQSVLLDSRLTYTKEFMLSLSNLHICKDLPEDFDGSALRELDGLSECKLGMQQTSAILPPYTSNNCYIASSPVLRCDLVTDSRGCCGRWEKQVSQGCCDSDSRAQNDCSGISGSFLSKSKNPYRPPQYYKVGSSNSYASHSSKGTKSLTNTASTAQEDVQSKNDTLQDDVVGDKSTHWSKQIANLPGAQKSFIRFVDEEKLHCKPSESIIAAITTQQEQLLDSEAKAPIVSINLEEAEKRQFGETLEKEVLLQHTGSPGIETRWVRGPCTGRMENGILTVNILAAESHENLKLNRESKEDFEIEISNELLSNEAFLPSQGNLCKRMSKSTKLQPNEFFVASVLSNCGAFGTDGESTRDSIINFELELDEIEEGKSPFDDFWTEILTVIHLEQESRDSYSADTVNITESEVPLHIPDEDELVLLNYQESPKEPKVSIVDTSIDSDFVEDEIDLPDEDSLISVDTLLSLSTHCSEVTFVGKTDRLMPNFTADTTGHPELAHCYDKSFPHGWKLQPSHNLLSSAAHQKPYPHEISSQTPCFHVNPEISTFHPLDLYFTCGDFKNLREKKHVRHYPAVYLYPWSNIHHDSSMKTTPPLEKKYEYLEQYSMLHQPNNLLQQMELRCEPQTDPIKQVVYDVVQQWDAMKPLPETYQQLHYPGFGFPL